MREALPSLSERAACKVLQVARSAMRPVAPEGKKVVLVDELLAERIRRLIEAHPTFGYRTRAASMKIGQASEKREKLD